MQNPKTNPKARERPMCPTQTFSNSGRWLWMSVTGWCGLVLPIKHLLSWVRYLHNHRVTWTPIDCHCWGLNWKIKGVFKKGWKSSTLVGLEGSSLSSPRVDIMGAPVKDRNFLSIATILEWVIICGRLVILLFWEIFITLDGCIVQHLGEECSPIGPQRPVQPASWISKFPNRAL